MAKTPSPAKPAARRTRPAAKAAAKAAPKAAPKAGKPAAAKPKAAGRKPAKAPGAKNATGKKMKTIRDSFNMPADDYALIAALKKRALDAATQVKKSELLRAGLRLLTTLGNDAFQAALAAVPAVKTGRPGKHRKG